MPTAAESKGFFAGLFDFTFENLVAPKVIKVLYGIFLFVIALYILAGLGAILMALIGGEILAALMIMVGLPFAAVFLLIGGRIYFELIILAFRVLETLDKIESNTRK